jgi:drug/metabolite transporter (DMT)-like permease
VTALAVQAAPFGFVLLWSTGYIGAKFILPYIEPFTFLLIRMCLAALLLFGLVTLFRQPRLAWRDWQHAAVVGLLLHGGYLGGIFAAIRLGIPAGLSAIIVNLQPVLISSLAALWLRESVSSWQWLGLGLGFFGVLLSIAEKSPDILGQQISLWGVVAVFVALFSSTGGTIYQKRFAAHIPLVSGTLVQYLAAGLVFLLLAFGFETRHIVWHPNLLWAMLWFVVVISLGAILLLLWLMQQNNATQVSSLFYLVPPLTALEAFWLFGEQLGVLSLFGFGLTMIGVALVVRK